MHYLSALYHLHGTYLSDLSLILYLSRLFLLCLESSVLFLLSLGKWLIEHLKLQRTLHIWSVSEPQNKLIAGLYTLVGFSCLVVQVCKLIRPLLSVFFVLVLFQNSDELIK